MLSQQIGTTGVAPIRTLPHRLYTTQRLFLNSAVDEVDGRAVGPHNRVEVFGLATEPRSGATTLTLFSRLSIAW